MDDTFFKGPGLLLRYALGTKWLPGAIRASWFIFIVPVMTIFVIGAWVVLVTLWAYSGVKALVLSLAAVYVPAFIALALKKKLAPSGSVDALISFECGSSDRGIRGASQSAYGAQKGQGIERLNEKSGCAFLPMVLVHDKQKGSCHFPKGDIGVGCRSRGRRISSAIDSTYRRMNT